MSEGPGPEEWLQMLNTINITLCRIYDVQMVILAETNPDAAADLDAVHEAGNFLTSPPSISENPFDWEEGETPVPRGPEDPVQIQQQQEG